MSEEYTIRNNCPCGDPSCRLNDRVVMQGGSAGYGGSGAYAGAGMSYASASTNTVPGTDYMRMSMDVGALQYGSVTMKEEKVWVSREELLRRGKWIPEYQDGEWQMRIKQVFPTPDNYPMYSQSMVDMIRYLDKPEEKRVSKADEVLKRIKDRRRKRRAELMADKVVSDTLKRFAYADGIL